MRKVLIIFFAVIICSCSELMDQKVPPLKPNQNEMIGRAKELYQLSSEILTKSGEGNSEGGFFYSTGESQVDWKNAESYSCSKTGTKNLEVPLTSVYNYVYTRDSVSYHECQKELLYLVSNDGERDGLYVVYYFPEEGSEYQDDPQLPSYISNSGEGDGYSGLKMYSTLDGVVVAVDEFYEGEAVSGVFMPEMSEDDVLVLYDMLKELTVYRIESRQTKAVSEAQNNYGGELEASICIAYRDMEDLQTWIDENGNRNFNPRDPGNGSSDIMNPSFCLGGNGGGEVKILDSNTLKLESIKGKLRTIRIKCKFDTTAYNKGLISNQLDSLFDEVSLLGREKYLSIIEKILDNQDKTEIVVTDTHKVSYTVPYKIKGEIFYRIYLRINDLNKDYMRALILLEELLHVYQAQMSPTWKKGDKEFEAKILLSLFSNSNFLFGEKERKKLEKYYNNPNSNLAYKNAYDAYEIFAKKQGYFQDEYPLTDSLLGIDKIIHIK